MNFASILAWIVLAACAIAALFIIFAICVLAYKSFRVLLHRLNVLDKKEV